MMLRNKSQRKPRPERAMGGNMTTIREKAEASVQQWLDANCSHISSHNAGEENSYCHIADNGYDYSDHIGGPQSVRTAFDEGWFYLTEKGIECCCQHQIPILPIEWDRQKIRRRAEDALRKSSDFATLLKVASLLEIRID